MSENKHICGGEIVAIPLFMVKNTNQKLKKEDNNKQFAFARAIEEEAGKILIEIFSKTGDLNTDFSDIISSDLLMKPLYTIWSGVRQKRWKVLFQTKNYNKYHDSAYNNIELVLGSIDNLRVWSAKDNSERPIHRSELGNYQLMGIYTPIQIENKIIEKMKNVPNK